MYSREHSCALLAISSGLFLCIMCCLWVKDIWTVSWYVKRKTYAEISSYAGIFGSTNSSVLWGNFCALFSRRPDNLENFLRNQKDWRSSRWEMNVTWTRYKSEKNGDWRADGNEGKTRSTLWSGGQSMCWCWILFTVYFFSALPCMCWCLNQELASALSTGPRRTQQIGVEMAWQGEATVTLICWTESCLK